MPTLRSTSIQLLDPGRLRQDGVRAINPKLAQRVRDADLLLAIGPRLGEITTSGYTLLAVPRPAQRLVHVHAGAEELGRVYQADLLVNSGMPQIARALAERGESRRWWALSRVGPLRA